MQGSRLYVGNLNYSVTSDQLKELFGNYGEVVNVNVIEGKGFGFVEFANSSDAESARDALNGTDFSGRTLKVDEARPPKNRGDRPPRRGGGGGPRRY